MAVGVEATVPLTVRETVKAVERLIREDDEEWVTNKALAKELDVDRAAASRRVRAAIDRGYLKNLEDRKGRPARLVLGEGMPEDQEVLPTPEDLQAEMSGCTVDRDFGGTQHPPPPSSGTGTNLEEGEGGYHPPETTSTDQPEEEWGLL